MANISFDLMENQLRYVVVAMNDAVAEPRKEYGTDELQKTEDGRQLYGFKNGELVVKKSLGEPAMSGVNIKLLNPVKLRAMELYTFTGKVNIMCYSSKNGLGVSITADSLKPMARNNPQAG